MKVDMRKNKYMHNGLSVDLLMVNLYDLMSLRNPVFKSHMGIPSWNEYFKEEIGKSQTWNTYATKRFKKSIWGNYLWRLIIRTFLEMLMRDLIYENDRFFFSHWKKKLYMKVTVRDNKKTADYKYNPMTGGDDYEPIFVYESHNQRIQLRNSLYWIKLTTRWRKKLDEQTIRFSYN